VHHALVPKKETMKPIGKYYTVSANRFVGEIQRDLKLIYENGFFSVINLINVNDCTNMLITYFLSFSICKNGSII
jgi:hypothetical protein